VELAATLRLAIAPLERQLRQQRADQFTPTQLSVIGAIFRHGPITIGDLAAQERLSPPTISRVVVVLEEHGLIERISDREDRRICRVAITASGRHWIDEGRARRNAWLAARISRLGPADRAALALAVPVLERLVDEAE
jgi:DNA-binding MarR family transcriptional regulator